MHSEHSLKRFYIQNENVIVKYVLKYRASFGFYFEFCTIRIQEHQRLDTQYVLYKQVVLIFRVIRSK